MRNKQLFGLALFLHLCIYLSAQVQVPPMCFGPPTAVSNCQEVCVPCTTFYYTGATAGWSPGPAPGFCSTVTNNQWLAFVAPDTQALFRLAFENCQNGDGLQLAVYEDCSFAPIACSPGMAGAGTNFIDLDFPTLPGKTYYLMVDGYNGDQCDFYLLMLSPSGGMPAGLGSTGAIQGPTKSHLYLLLLYHPYMFAQMIYPTNYLGAIGLQEPAFMR